MAADQDQNPSKIEQSQSNWGIRVIQDGYKLEGFDIPEVTLEVSQSQIMPLTQWQKEQKILEKIYRLPVDKLEKLDAYLNQLIA